MFRVRRPRKRTAICLTLGAAALVGIAMFTALANWRLGGLRRIHTSLTATNLGLLIGVAGLAAAVMVPFVVASLQRSWSRIDNADASRSARDREFMLRRVENKWIRDIYDANVAVIPEISLSLKVYACADPAPGGRPPSRATSKTLIKVLERTDGSLLILGAPGAGKTTLLLRLIIDLLLKARADLVEPIPVIFLLSSWAKRKLPLSDWLIEELARSYDVPRRTALRWVAANEILPLLDGLDEIPKDLRSDCIAAIKRFKDENSLTQFVICSRTADYITAARVLEVDRIEIQPLTRRQLTKIFDPRYLTDVLQALQAEGPLAELLRTPLGVRILGLLYSPGAGPGVGAPSTPVSRVADLFDVYVKQMFSQRRGRLGQAETVRWLAWLANSMQEHSQTEFQLDRLKPDWLPTRAARRAAVVATAAVTGLLIGLCDMAVYSVVYGPARGFVNGIAIAQFFFIFVLLVQAERSGRFSWPLRRAGLALLGAVVVGLVLWAEASPTDGVLWGLFFAVASVLFANRVRTDPVEEFRWFWRRAGFGFCLGAGAGVIIGVIYGRGYGLVSGLPLELEFSLPFGLALGVFGSLAGGVAPGLSNQRSYPNEAVHRSARLALVSMLASISVTGTAFAIVFHGALRMRIGLGAGLRDSLLVGMAVGMLMGGLACIQHVMLRVLLAWKKLAPLSYAGFLDEASSDMFLRRTGSGYMFVHGTLQEYFAALLKR